MPNRPNPFQGMVLSLMTAVNNALNAEIMTESTAEEALSRFLDTSAVNVVDTETIYNAALAQGVGSVYADRIRREIGAAASKHAVVFESPTKSGPDNTTTYIGQLIVLTPGGNR